MTTDPPDCDVNGWCDMPGGHRGECRSATDQTIEGPGVVPSDGGEAPVTTRPVPTLADLRRLGAAATPGPWHPDDENGVGVIRTYRSGLVMQGGILRTSPHDAALIAAMRNALPALLAVAEAALGHRAAYWALKAHYDPATLAMTAEEWSLENDRLGKRFRDTAADVDGALRALEDQP